MLTCLELNLHYYYWSQVVKFPKRLGAIPKLAPKLAIFGEYFQKVVRFGANLEIALKHFGNFSNWGGKVFTFLR